jgi:RES domain
MSSPIWTPAALSSELTGYEGRCWRLVEAQHKVSTLKLVNTLEEQSILEDLVEETKPAIPADCRHLDYLLATPFRYSAEYPKGSRFRRAGRTLGVYYAAEEPETAVAEMAFYRLLFFAESPQTPWPGDAAEYTAFAAAVATEKCLDLTRPPLVKDRAIWVDPIHYEPCQNLADAARATGTAVIRYESVRDRLARANLAVLECAAFAEPQPLERQTWRMRLSRTGVQAICEFPQIRIEFDPDAFGVDFRIANFNWER